MFAYVGVSANESVMLVQRNVAYGALFETKGVRMESGGRGDGGGGGGGDVWWW
jgi:hypothetical protein